MIGYEKQNIVDLVQLLSYLKNSCSKVQNAITKAVHRVYYCSLIVGYHNNIVWSGFDQIVVYEQIKL